MWIYAVCSYVNCLPKINIEFIIVNAVKPVIKEMGKCSLAGRVLPKPDWLG